MNTKFIYRVKQVRGFFMFKFLILMLLTILFTSCTSPYDKPLKISATTWVGYIPLYYAKEKGWLEPLNIKLTNVVSLSENMALYRSGNFDAYVGTQYEYGVISEKDKSLFPVMMFDRSFGGDIVMSNVSVEDLQQATSKIDVYLEMDSINITILRDFVKKYHINNGSLNFINKDQLYISTLEEKNIKNPTIIVTYTPYNAHLKNNGFHEIVSTKDGLDLLVVDAMFTTDKVFSEHQEQFVELKKLVDRAVQDLEADPKAYYETIKAYLPNTTYDDFQASLQDITWINKEISPELIERMKLSNFPMRGIIK